MSDGIDRLAGYSSSVAIKAPCHYSTSSNIALSGLAVQAGGSWVTTLTQDDDNPTRILVLNQTNPADNGIWNPAAGTWQRAKDFDGARDVVQGTIVHVHQSSGDLFYEVTTANPIVIGTSSLAFQASSSSDILTQLANSASPTQGASLIGWIRAAVGAVAYTVGEWLGWQEPNVLEFMTLAQRTNVLAFTGTVDVTAPCQAAITAAAAAGRLLKWPAGRYLITDTLSFPVGTHCLGEFKNMGIAGFNIGTRIQFSPTTAKSLFVPASAAVHQVGFYFEGFDIRGNSVSSVGNSIYAFDIANIDSSTFGNMMITGFRTGIRCYATLRNEFRFIKIANTYISSVLYDGGISTIDDWIFCYFINGVIAVQTNGDNRYTRFWGCSMETMTSYGANLVKETVQFMFIGCRSEDCPSGNTATNATFRVGYDGSVLSTVTQLQVDGGSYQGRNAGSVGSMVDIDFTDGVILGGFHANGYTQVVKTSSNTQTNQVSHTPWHCTSVSTTVTDETKSTGMWPLGPSNGSTRNQQVFRGASIKETAAGTACTGALSTVSGALAQWKVSRTGDQVMVTLPQTQGNASAATNFAYGDALPSKYRPTGNVSQPILIRDNGNNLAAQGFVVVNATTGVITVFKDAVGTGSFTAGNTAGIAQGGATISWTI
jgi:hypothetical protein